MKLIHDMSVTKLPVSLFLHLDTHPVYSVLTFLYGSSTKL